MTELSAFLHLYLYQIERQLNSNTSLLESIIFQSDEANTDSDLKLFLKGYILDNPELTDQIQVSSVIYERGVDDDSTQYNAGDISKYRIENVFLKAELTEQHVAIIKAEKKGSVYTDPDLLLLITDGTDHQYVTLELKSTKNDKIPGSSVQQVLPFEWVIFVYHNGSSFKVVTGQYINTITSRLPFPDRSPRPEVGLKTLISWNDTNRVVVGNSLTFKKDDTVDAKLSILKDWQSVLIDEWMGTVTKNSAKKREKWFNRTIRLFSSKLLHYYETLSAVEKKKLIEHIDSNAK